MQATVIIAARNAAATLRDTLEGLERQRGAPAFDVVVVDDGSDDATAEIARAAALQLELLSSGGQGPGAARNAGAAAARGDMLVFLDADCRPEPDWLARLLSAARSAELVQGAVLPPEGVPIGPFDRYVAVVSEYGLYQTANLAIARSLFERIGGFEPVAMPGRGKELGEDAWLGWRARRAGARSAFAADAVVRHAVFPRGPRAYLAEELRVRWFPRLVRHMPELRGTFLHRRWFLSPRSARFDLALGGAAAAAAARSPLPLLAAAPYVRVLWSGSGRWGARRRAQVAPVQLAADVIRAGALLWGSAANRRAVL
jgi:glycosyltransferase involved in cell wall biosynthesis